MKTRKSLLYLLLAGMLCNTACKKENTSQPPPAIELSRQLVQITDAINSPTTVYKYDEKGRLIEGTGGYNPFKYAYTNNVFSALFSNQNNTIYSELYNGKLDNSGRLVEADAVYHPPNGPDSYYKYVITYDANGYVSTLVHTNLNTNTVSKDEFVFLDGNMIKDINTVNGQPNYREEFTYYDNLPNKLSFDYLREFSAFYSDGLTGKRSKNLRKSTQNFDAQNVKNIDYTYTYDLDAQGYPLKYRLKNVITNFETEYIMLYNK